jgi:hypothetical protein
MYEQEVFHMFLNCCCVAVFYFMFTLRCKQTDILEYVSSSASTTLMINYRWVSLLPAINNKNPLYMFLCITGIKESEIAAGPAQLIPSANPGHGTLKALLLLSAISATKPQSKAHLNYYRF